MSYANPTNQVFALKEKYDNPSQYMKDLVYAKNPMMALLPKDENPDGFAGKYIPVPLVFATPAGRSATFANAQTNQTAPAGASFFVYRVSNYQLVTITNELLEATKNNAAAFVDEATLNMDTGFRNIGNDCAGDLFRSGTGSRGQIAAGGYSKVSATVTITLASTSQVTQFEVGMTLVACATDGGAPSADTVQLTAVNRSSGIIVGTASTGGSGLSGNWAALSYLAVQGDVAASGSTGTSSYLKIAGLGAWLPYGGPASSGDNFWGVDRYQDSVRMAGFSADYSTGSIEEGLTDLLFEINLQGGSPDFVFVNFTSYRALIKELGAKVQYVQIDHDEADISFEGVKVISAYGPATVIPDRSCPSQMAYALQLNTWKLRSLGKVPHVLTYGLEGLEGVRVGNADALEIRIGYYANLICSAPGWNGVARLSA